MPLFQVAIIQKPTKKELEEGTGEELLVLEPKWVMGRDSQMAAIRAVTKDLPPDIDMNRAEVLVRPFV